MIQSVWKNLTGLQKAAEHLWCDFKWATNSSPNTNDLYIHYMDKSTGTPSLEENNATPNCANIIHVLVFPSLLHQFWSVWKDWTHMYKSLVFGDEFLSQGLFLKSSFKHVTLHMQTCFMTSRRRRTESVNWCIQGPLEEWP